MAQSRRFPSWPAEVVAACGLVLHVVEGWDSLMAGRMAVLFFMAYGMLPYLAAVFGARILRGMAFPALIGSLAVLGWDFSFYWDVFVAPGSSTAPILMLFAPVACVVFGLCPGVLLGYLIQWAFQARKFLAGLARR